VGGVPGAVQRGGGAEMLVDYGGHFSSVGRGEDMGRECYLKVHEVAWGSYDAA
jgi:hypothetical protein